ncbi:MAG: UDP-N-acetyl-D-glucosamine dehydrogenase, partial [Candidatus Tectomicrobia bacterium]|nr:UDP-N-acetyl-D-glucosamine dehydrogenase [Candidatus Tectomicrobia bacterium]
FGFMPFYPGPGLGGHCIPIDPHYLAWKLKTLDYKARFIELASEINADMPFHVVSKIADVLNCDKKSLNGSRILILGVSYKRDVNDVRESPALDIIKLLQQRLATVFYHDPYVPKLDTNLEVTYLDLTAENLQQMDCVVIVTDHSGFDCAWIVDHSRRIVDTRNATKGIVRGKEKVVKL